MHLSTLFLFIASAAANTALSHKNTNGHCFAQRRVTHMAPFVAADLDDLQPEAAKEGDSHLPSLTGAIPEIQELDARGRTKDFRNPTGVVVKGRDGCPCMKNIPQSLAPKWNISAEIPEGLEMKHAGWTVDYSDKGIGIFATKTFKKGDLVGGAHARVVPCKGAEVQTPMGVRSLNCEIHFFDLPKCSGGTVSVDDEKVAIFPSWMSFLNSPDEYDETTDKEVQNSGVGANLEFGFSTCKRNPSEESEWTLVASQDILPGNELTVLYDETALRGMTHMKKKAKKSAAKPYSVMKVAMKKARKAMKAGKTKIPQEKQLTMKAMPKE